MTIQTDEKVNPPAAALAELIKILGINKFSQDKQNDLIIKMTEVLLKRIFLETMEKLDEKGREEYEKMNEGEVAPKEMEMFLKNNIKDYDGMVLNIIEEFKSEMMDQDNIKQ